MIRGQPSHIGRLTLGAVLNENCFERQAFIPAKSLYFAGFRLDSENPGNNNQFLPLRRSVFLKFFRPIRFKPYIPNGGFPYEEMVFVHFLVQCNTRIRNTS